MKKIIFSALILLPVIIYAQPGKFIIKGKIGKLSSPDKAYLFYDLNNKSIKDSTIISNGIFEFRGTINEPTKAFIALSHDAKPLQDGPSDYKTIYLENGSLSIVAPDSVKNSQVSGGRVNAEFQLLNDTLLGEVNKAEDKLNKEYNAVTAEERHAPVFKAAIDKRFNVVYLEQKAILLEFIQLHPKSFISLSALMNQYADNPPDASKILPLYNSLSGKVRETVTGKRYGAFLKIAATTSVGRMAPNFTLPDSSGKQIRLSNFRGHYVLVDFWASWCGPCRMENPNVVKAYEKFSNKGFKIVGVSLDEAKSKWLKAIRDDHLTWVEVSDLKGWESKTAKLYAIKAIPQNALIDPGGKIVAKNLRGEDLNQKLIKIYGQSN